MTRKTIGLLGGVLGLLLLLVLGAAAVLYFFFEPAECQSGLATSAAYQDNGCGWNHSFGMDIYHGIILAAALTVPPFLLSRSLRTARRRRNLLAAEVAKQVADAEAARDEADPDLQLLLGHSISKADRSSQTEPEPATITHHSQLYPSAERIQRREEWTRRKAELQRREEEAADRELRKRLEEEEYERRVEASRLAEEECARQAWLRSKERSRQVRQELAADDDLRWRVFQRDDHSCQECGSKTRLTVDHIHPVSLGGDNDEGNLRTLCRPCNSRKGIKILL